MFEGAVGVGREDIPLVKRSRKAEKAQFLSMIPTNGDALRVRVADRLERRRLVGSLRMRAAQKRWRGLKVAVRGERVFLWREEAPEVMVKT